VCVQVPCVYIPQSAPAVTACNSVHVHVYVHAHYLAHVHTHASGHGNGRVLYVVAVLVFLPEFRVVFRSEF
jgi:hypothetical protein